MYAQLAQPYLVVSQCDTTLINLMGKIVITSKKKIIKNSDYLPNIPVVLGGLEGLEDVAVIWLCLVRSLDRWPGFLVVDSIITSLACRFLLDPTVPPFHCEYPRHCGTGTRCVMVCQNPILYLNPHDPFRKHHRFQVTCGKH